MYRERCFVSVSIQCEKSSSCAKKSRYLNLIILLRIISARVEDKKTTTIKMTMQATIALSLLVLFLLSIVSKRATKRTQKRVTDIGIRNVEMRARFHPRHRRRWRRRRGRRRRRRRVRRRIGRRERRRWRKRRWWRRRHERHYYVILCPKRRKWWSRQTNFEDFSKAAQRRFQLCGKERDKKEDTKRHSTRRKEHTDTVYA